MNDTSVLERHARFEITEIFFFRSPHSSENLTVRLYRNSLQLLACSFESEEDVNVSTSTNATLQCAPPSASPVPRLSLANYSKRHYLHSHVELIVEAQTILSLRSRLPAEKFEFIFLADTPATANVFHASVTDRQVRSTHSLRIAENELRMQRAAKALTVPSQLTVKLNSAEETPALLALSPELDSLVLSSPESSDKLHSLPLKAISALSTIYREGPGSALQGRLILECQGEEKPSLWAASFEDHTMLVKWFLALQHLLIELPDGCFRCLSARSAADLYLRKARIVARRFFAEEEREQIEDIQIPQQTKESVEDKENCQQLDMKPLQRSSQSQRALVSRRFFQASSSSSQRALNYIDLNRHQSMTNIYASEKRSDRRQTAATPLGLGSYRGNKLSRGFFDNSCEVDPDLDQESNNAQQSLASYSSIPSFHKGEAQQSQSQREGGGGGCGGGAGPASVVTQSTCEKSKSSKVRTDASPYHQLFSSVIKRITTPFESVRSPKTNIFTSLVPLFSPTASNSTLRPNLPVSHQTKRSFVEPQPSRELFSPPSPASSKSLRSLSAYMAQREQEKEEEEEEDKAQRSSGVEAMAMAMQTLATEVREDTEPNHPVSPCPPRLCQLRITTDRRPSPLSTISPSLRRIGALRGNKRGTGKRGTALDGRVVGGRRLSQEESTMTPTQDVSNEELKELYFRLPPAEGGLFNQMSGDAFQTRETGQFPASSPPFALRPSHVLEQNIRELKLQRSESDDFRSELQDHIHEEMMDEFGPANHHRSSSSLTTFKNTFASKKQHNLNDTAYIDPELAALFANPPPGTIRRPSADDMQLGVNPRLSLALSQVSSRKLPDLETATFDPRRMPQPHSARHQKQQQQQQQGSQSARDLGICSQTTGLFGRSERSPCSTRPSQLQYQERYLEEKERHLQLQQEYQELLRRQHQVSFRVEQKERNWLARESEMEAEIARLRRENAALKESRRSAQDGERRARTQLRRAQAESDILSVRLRGVEKYLMPKRVCLRKPSATRL